MLRNKAPQLKPLKLRDINTIVDMGVLSLEAMDWFTTMLIQQCRDAGVSDDEDVVDYDSQGEVA